MPVGCELRAALQADTAGTPQSPVATKKVPRLWEQNAAGSNPVSPTAISAIPQTAPAYPVRKHRVFLWSLARLSGHHLKFEQHQIALKQARLSLKEIAF